MEAHNVVYYHPHNSHKYYYYYYAALCLCCMNGILMEIIIFKCHNGSWDTVQY